MGPKATASVASVNGSDVTKQTQLPVLPPQGILGRMTSEMPGRAPKVGVLPLSVFGALFVSAARIILGHPAVAAFRKSAKKDAF